tara:strand:- start:4720 stop:5751 length:1032 start_codon:yes stop_codon:yes gene_type:complete
LDISEFDYNLPEELIAQSPINNRDESRLLLLDRAKQTISHHIFKELPDLLNKNDVLVFNNTKVMKCRLIGEIVGSKRKVEILFLNQNKDGYWECIGKPGRYLKNEVLVTFDEDLRAEIVAKNSDGTMLVNLSDDTMIEKLGTIPLPPYINNHEQKNTDRYQTVYATDTLLSAAAPTAGLHFSNEILKSINLKGIEKVELSLQIGLGTFQPIRVDNIHEHNMHSEQWIINDAAAHSINSAKNNHKRILSVGTTVTRTLESAYLTRKDKSSTNINSGSGWTDLFIKPGFKFNVIDMLLTNFHLPKSTLLVLLSSFASKDFIMEAYNEAIKEKYRFYSFGDAMLII